MWNVATGNYQLVNKYGFCFADFAEVYRLHKLEEEDQLYEGDQLLCSDSPGLCFYRCLLHSNFQERIAIIFLLPNQAGNSDRRTQPETLSSPSMSRYPILAVWFHRTGRQIPRSGGLLLEVTVVNTWRFQSHLVGIEVKASRDSDELRACCLHCNDVRWAFRPKLLKAKMSLLKLISRFEHLPCLLKLTCPGSDSDGDAKASMKHRVEQQNAKFLEEGDESGSKLFSFCLENDRGLPKNVSPPKLRFTQMCQTLWNDNSKPQIMTFKRKSHVYHAGNSHIVTLVPPFKQAQILALGMSRANEFCNTARTKRRW